MERLNGFVIGQAEGVEEAAGRAGGDPARGCHRRGTGPDASTVHAGKHLRKQMTIDPSHP